MDSLEELGQAEQVETHGLGSGKKWQPQQKQTSLICFDEGKKMCKRKRLFESVRFKNTTKWADLTFALTWPNLSRCQLDNNR